MASAFWLLLAGAGIADGKASVLQTKSYSIKQNGNYAFTPDAGYDGFSSINVSVAVEAKLQEKSITPTKQEQTVTPDAGFEGLSKIVVGAIPASYIDTSGANATAPDILAPKTAYVNGELVTGTMQEYDGSVTNGTEGMKPQLNAPTIAVSGRQLTITNPSTNGNFTEGYKIFVDGVEKSEQTANTLDLYTYFDEDGTYQLSVAAAAAQFADSNQSAKATYQKETPTSGVVWLKNAEPLSVGRRYMAGATNGNFAVFAGGESHSSYAVNLVDAFDNTLVRSSPTSLTTRTAKEIGVQFGENAVFAGGFDGTWNSEVDIVVSYNNNLVQQSVSPLSQPRRDFAAASGATHCIMGGGIYASTVVKNTDAYDANFTKVSIEELSVKRFDLAANAINNYILFAGGRTADDNYSASAVVDVYDSSLTKSIGESLSVARQFLGSANVGNYVLFAGGAARNSFIATVDAYDTALTRISATNLSSATSEIAGVNLDGYAIMQNAGVCNSYDENLTRAIVTSVVNNRTLVTVAPIGNYAIFAGGSSFSSLVDVYTVKE